MKQTAYTKAAAAHAKILIEQGWTNEQIKGVEVCKDIPAATLRSLRFRANGQKSNTVATPQPLQHENETPLQRETATQQQLVQLAENAAKTSEIAVFAKNVALNFHPADLLYYLGVAIACNGIVSTLQSVGVAVAASFLGVAFIALQLVKSATGATRWASLAVMALFEVVAAAVHYSWANAALWANVKALPFDITEAIYRHPDTGKLVSTWVGSQTAWPSYTACGVAAVLFVAGAYACILPLLKK